MAKYSEAQKRAVAKYNAKSYDEIKIRVPKGRKAIISTYAASKGKSTNGLINELLEIEISRTHEPSKRGFPASVKATKVPVKEIQ